MGGPSATRASVSGSGKGSNWMSVACAQRQLDAGRKACKELPSRDRSAGQKAFGREPSCLQLNFGRKIHVFRGPFNSSMVHETFDAKRLWEFMRTSSTGGNQTGHPLRRLELLPSAACGLRLVRLQLITGKTHQIRRGALRGLRLFAWPL